MNVFDLRGPDFLWFYTILLSLTLITALILRWGLRGPGGDMSHLIRALEPCEAAYLAGGPKMVVDAALAGLVHGGALKLDRLRGGFKVKSPLVGEVDVIEQRLFGMVERGADTLASLRAAAGTLTSAMAERLMAGNLALSTGQALVAQAAPAMLLLPVLLIGLNKISVGLSRGRPVAILVFLCTLTTGLMVILAFKRVRRTRAGDRMMSRLRSQNSALRVTVGVAPHRVPQEDMALAIALFGPRILVSGDLLGVRQTLWPVNSLSGGGCGSGGSSCGGGGCGGGGCGGCGGG
jgi:uncharacterized protein (TIGR04222 family)